MRQLVLFRPLWVLLAVGAVAAAAYGASRPKTETAVPKVLRAQSFELVNSDNRVCARLGTTPDGETRLELLDPKGVSRARLELDEKEPRPWLCTMSPASFA